MEISIEDIDDLYVPFNELSESNVENIFLEDAKKEKMGKFYGIIADSGFGKSSFLNYLLIKLSNYPYQTFCVKLNEFPEQLNEDPKVLLNHILTKVFRIATEVNKMDKADVKKAQELLAHSYTYTSSEKNGINAGIKAKIQAIPMIFGIEADARGHLETQAGATIENKANLEELIDFMNHLIDLLQKEAKMKHVVIMIDETDKITPPKSNEPSSELAKSFFGKMIPVLSKTNCTYIFVLNSKYDSKEFQKEVIGNYFDQCISIPRLDSVDDVKKIIEKRTKAVCGDIGLNEIWEEDGIRRLYEFYQESSLRHLMNACKFSIGKAWKDEAEIIMSFHVKEAIMDIPKY